MGNTTKRFEELRIWQLSRKLAKEVWEVSREGTFAKDFALKDQVNRAAGSTMDNIAEGHDRGGNKEFIHFLSIARASNSEVRSQLLRAFDRKHLNKGQLTPLYDLNIEIGVKITKFIQRLRDSGFRGQKFKS